MNKTLYKPEKTISILGCGWLGLPLAKFFIKNGYSVKGSTPTPEKISILAENGIIPYRILLNPEINTDFDADFFNSEIIVVNFPPKRREDIEEFHPQQFKALIEQVRLSSIKKLIFISSTSVYANLNRIVTEADNQISEKNSGKALRVVENMLLAQDDFKTSIIRFGGLIGYDRKPGRFFSKMKNAVEGDTPVNLIHQDDCIGIISHVIENGLWGETYNACCPEHPTRKEFYIKAAKSGGFELPQFVANKSTFKIISSAKLEKTNYKFKYANPIEALAF
ncbi:Rossmann-fold NAD(P)-binding domain-containing protein [Labilibaculum antarcticum]|uniref:NAD(P)-dependent oxidoreductase n=1 Tax=Labilibaculum antarcticum TaxID=1717717 RepID=A0A1Y1CSL6_9BACT|nr:NAD(P)-dependent oxidoreductase [Labilibaculum antarcticum]BAX82231.1 NAD(P)-dependent oxidoreductase [Labilibaculum antarcticum]